MATGLVFDFDDPDVGVKPHLAGEIGCGLALADGAGRKATHPPPLRLAAFQARRSGAVELDRTVEPVEANVDGAGVLVATANDDRGQTLDLTAAQIGFHPDFAFDAHRSAKLPLRGARLLSKGRAPSHV